MPRLRLSNLEGESTGYFSLKIGGVEQAKTVRDAAASVTFELELEAGMTRLETLLK